MRCKQCDWCDARDSDEYGFFCIVSCPIPEITDGRCNHFNPEHEEDLWRFHPSKVAKEKAAAFREQLIQWKDAGIEPKDI